LADGQIFDWVMNGDALGLPAVTPQTQVCIILVALAGALILCIWVFLVTVSAPFLIAKALRSGSGIFGEMVGGTAKGAAGLAAAAAGLAALAMTGGGAAATAGAGRANAMAALGNGSSLAQAGVGSGGGGAASRSVASRATMRAPAGSGGIYAAGASGDVAYIPMSQGEMAAAFAGDGGNSGGGSSGGAGGSSGGSGGSGKAGGGKSARVSGSSARAYKAVMAMGALHGVLEAASQWDGGADIVSHTASRASSNATNQYDRSRRLDRQDFDGNQEQDDDKA
jgi:hypothetical protein